MKRNNKTKQFEKNVKAAIEEIHSSLQNGPLNVGFAKYRQDNAFVSSGCALLNLGAVENLGSVTRPNYIWNDEVQISPNLIRSVIEYIREKAKYSKKKKAVVAAPVMQSAMVLTNFTDQQLWDELKARKYSIQNNQLCKIHVLL